MFKHLAMGALCAGLIACGGGTESSPETQQPAQSADLASREVVSVAEMLANSPDGKVVVDLRNTNQGFRVEGGLDYSAITVICPSSRTMNLKEWTPELASIMQTTPAKVEKGFTMYPFMAPAKGTVTQQAAPVCTSPDPYTVCNAEREADGSWSCMCTSA